MDEVNKLVKEIAQTAFDTVPVDSWTKVVMKVAILATYVELTSAYYIGEQEGAYLAEYADAPDKKAVDDLFIDLRQATYALTPGKGAWYNAELTVTDTGEFNITYDYDNPPAFEMTADDQEFRIDTKEFPRNAESTPAWLAEYLK